MSARRIRWGALVCFFVAFGGFGYIALNPEKKTIEIEKLDGPINNPLMGWAPWASLKTIKQPHSLVYADLTWRELEPSPGVYDFSLFEEEKQIERWRREGKRVVFRFVADYPGRDKHMDIPDWLYDLTGGDGIFYENEYGKGYSPNYSNPIYIERHELALNALADRYGRDGFFAFIELGSLGHWGEWHTHPDVDLMPRADIREIYIRQYRNAFPQIHLLTRRPLTEAQPFSIGLYNDMTGSFGDTDIWLQWVAGGGDFNGEMNAMSPMPFGWQTVPIGGEQAPTLSDDFVYGSNLDETLLLLARSHTTFIGPVGGYDVPLGGYLQPGVDRVISLVGYRLVVEQAEFPVLVRLGNTMNGTVTMSNKGIAPFYYDWTVRAYVFSEDGNVVMSRDLQVDLRKILPGKKYSIDYNLPLYSLPSGHYSLGLAVIDPLTNAPAIRFANVNPRSDLIQEIGSFEIRRLFDAWFSQITDLQWGDIFKERSNMVSIR